MNCLPFVCYQVNYFTMYTEYALYNEELFVVSKLFQHAYDMSVPAEAQA